MKNLLILLLGAVCISASTPARGNSEIKPNKTSSLKMQKQDFTFFNIVPYSIGNETAAAADAIEYTKKTGNRIVLYSLTLHPQYPSCENLKMAAASFRKFKNALAGTDVQPGILLQAILGHWARLDKQTDPWQRSIDLSGEEKRFCVLDTEFQKYIYAVGETLAKEKPFFFMTDDDIRAYPSQTECFCQLHAAEFSKRMGKKYSPAEYLEAVKQSKPKDKVYETFFKLQREIPETTVSIIRRAIDSVDPTIPTATCMPGVESLHAGKTALKAASRYQTPMMRIANAYYMESASKDYPYVLFRTMAYYAQHEQQVPLLLDESDTFPHNLYSRSARNFHTKLCSSAFIGLAGAKVWYVNMHKSGAPVHRRYTEVLARNRNMYQAIAREAKNSVQTGVIVPLHRNNDIYHAATNPGNDMFERFGWGETQLGMYGIPYRVSFKLDEKDVYLVSSANSIKRFSDAELKTLLSGKLILDGAAATEVTKRGFAHFLGVKAEAKEFPYSREKRRDNASLTVMDRLPEVPFLTVLDPKIEVLSDLCFVPRSNDPLLEVLSPGTTVYRNSLGGTVCVTSFCTVYRANHQVNEFRKDFLLHILDKLNSEPLPFVVMDYQNVAALTRKCADGATLLAIFNINIDRLEPITVRCQTKPASAEFLNSDGKWQKVDFSYENGLLCIQYGLECLEGGFFRLK